MFKHRCTGLLISAVIWLIPGLAFGQSPEELLDAGEARAAALAFTERGQRTDLLAAGNAWASIDSFDLAREAYGQVIDDPDSLSGLAQHKIGVAFYNGYRDGEAAIAYRKAIQIRDAAFGGAHLDRAHSRSNLAQTLIPLGQSDTSALLLREAIEIFASVSPTDSLNWMRSLTSLALLSERSRDYQTGISSTRRAVALLEGMKNLDPYDEFDTWYSAGKTYFVFKDFPEAKAATLHARAAASETGDPVTLLQALNLLGGIATEEGRDRESIDFRLQALELGKGAGIGGEDVGLLHFNLARSYGKLGDTRKSFFHSRQAFDLLAEAQSFLPRLHSVEGDLYRRDGDLSTSLKSFNTGVGLLIGAEGSGLHYPNPDSLEGPQLEVLADLLGDRADVLTSLERRAEAREDYNLLFAVQDLLRNQVSSDVSRRYLSKNLRKFFDRAIDLEFMDYQSSPSGETAWRAFALSERAKAYSLLTALQRDRNEMPKREIELRTRIAELERKSAAGAPENELLAAARLQLDRLIRLRAEKSDLSIPEFSQSAIVGLVRDEDFTLVAFHLGEARGFLFTLSPEGNLSFNVVEGVLSLPAAIDAWRESIRQSAYRKKSLRTKEEQSALDEVFLTGGLKLFEQLFGAGSLLNGPAAFGNAQLCIIPDGPLAMLPFGALPLSTAELPLDYGSLLYLQTNHDVSYAYSARVLVESAEKTPLHYEQNLLAFAPEFQGSTNARTMTRAAVLRDGERALSGLSPLKFNRPEVEEIASLVSGTSAYFGSEANRQTFLDNLGKARVLHLSTHGVVNSTNPNLSFVAFSQLGDSLEMEEMLYHNDLSALPIKAELAVLSACETSLGAYAPGETTLSLASAFAAAGARSTLTTLWQVDDAATKELIVNFYEQLAAGKERSEALAMAQRAHREGGDYSHPYYWSAMTLYGDSGPLKLEADVVKWWMYLVGGAFLLLFTGLFFVRRRKA